VIRHLFTTLAVLSMVLCGMTTAWWARSGYVSDLWTWGSGSEEYWLRSDWGRVTIMRVSNASARQAYETGSGGFSGTNPGPIAGQRKFFGITYTWGRSLLGRTIGPTLRTTGRGSYWALTFYHPLLIAPLGSPAILHGTLYFLRRHRDQRIKRRLAAMVCVKCGYDMRATPDCCPECGTMPEKNLQILT
jgi:hypothetical protein